MHTIESSASAACSSVRPRPSVVVPARSQTELLLTVKSALERWSTGGAAPSLPRAEIDAVTSLAWAMFEATRFAEAADLFQLVTLCHPQQAGAWLGLGASREALGQTSAAQVAYEAASIAPIGAEDRLHARDRLQALDEGPRAAPKVTPRPLSSVPAPDRPRAPGAQRRP